MKRLVIFLAILASLAMPGIGEALPVLFTEAFLKYSQKTAPFYKSGQGSLISVEGAGNETVTFQLVLPETDIQGKIFNLGLKGLENVATVKWFALENCQGLYPPDCLVPIMDGEFEINGFDKVYGHKILFGDIHIPPKAKAGKYKGVVEINSQWSPVAKIPLELSVYPFSLPRKPSLAVDLNNYGFPKNHPAYYTLAREHRMGLNCLPYKSQRGTPHPGKAPIIKRKNGKIISYDWKQYDRTYGPLFDGSAFEDKIPLDHHYLPFNPDWPSPFINYIMDRELYEREWREVAREFTRHFREKGWNRTVFQVYLNQKPAKNNRVPWNLDEPKGVKDYMALKYYANLTHLAFPRKENPNVRFRIDISHFYCRKHKGNPAKDFRINKGFEILKPVDIWVISRHSLDAPKAREKALELQSMGKTVYEYFSGTRMPLIKDSPTKAITFGWNAWLRQEDGILFWNTVKSIKRYSDGRSFLIYPGELRDLKGPISSLRLKAIRRGIQDYEYFKIASRFGNYDSMIKKHMTKNPMDYIKLKRKIGEAISWEMRNKN